MRLAVFIVLAGVMPVLAADKPTAEEQAAIDFVARSGGKAALDSNLSREARVSAKFEAISDNTLIALKKYPQIGGVDSFDAARCTDKGFSALKELPHLHKLALGKSSLTPAAAAAIGQCVELRHLSLSNAGLTDAGLASLKDLARLEHLSLAGNPRVTDKGMQTVKGFDRLQVLYLNQTAITNKGLAELKVLDGLRSLNVTGTGVTADAAEKFPDDMPNLRVVRR